VAGCSDIWIKMLNRFRCRQREPELMDQPGLGEPLHRAALAGLGRINRFSGSGRILWQALERRIATNATRTWRLLDLASGGGDVAIDVARRAARAGARVLVDGCDVSPFAVRYATARASERQVENVQFFRQDVLNAPLPEGYDVVMCSLFLHHLPEETASALLGKMAAAAQRLVLVNDLCRSTFGYGLAWLGCRFLTRSPIVHVDGPRSVQSAFSMKEIREVARQGGLSGVVVEPRWPCRFFLQWSRD
jgi:SAM-dependent methyltransferase